MSHPAAYLRRSFVDAESPGDISLEAQRAAVRKLAAADGHNGNTVEYNDWGVSADVAKSGKRTAYSKLLADMEAGLVSAVYAFDVDRLYRDPRDLIRLQDAAQRHKVRIATTAGPLAIGEGDDPAAEGFAFITAVFGRMELQKTKKRAVAALAARRTRGDTMGHPPFGWRTARDEDGRITHVRDESIDIDPIRAAYREVGTVLGAVKLLNTRGIVSAEGGRWYTSALTRTIRHNWPEMLPDPTGRTRQVAPSMALSRLLRCHCGATMTPNFHRAQYYCSRGHVTAGHGQYTVQEMYVLPFVQARVDALEPPGDRVKMAEDTAARREALNARMERNRFLFLDDPDYGQGAYEAEKARVTDALGALDNAETVVDLPRIDWTWPATDVNRLLRRLIDHVVLGPDLRPIDVVWRGRIAEWAR